MNQNETTKPHQVGQSKLADGIGDPEIKAMTAAVEYMEYADERSRQRFLIHLHHRYWDAGHVEFESQIPFNFNDILMKKPKVG